MIKANDVKILPVSRNRGLTLVEMLVVIMLVSMVVTLLVQGLGSSMGLYQRIVSEQGQRYHHAMIFSWLRDSIEAAVPNSFEKERFNGSLYALNLATFSPLIDTAYTNKIISWQVTDSPPWVLEYQEGSELIKLPLSVDSRPYFEYQDQDQRWHDRWPVKSADYRLPEAVRFVVGEAMDDYEITMPVRAHRQAQYYNDEIMYGRD